ncbi:hypothetical protein D3C86_924440 [compost metagenome]
MLKTLNFSPSPDGSKYPFVPVQIAIGTGAKDTAYSGREVVMKNHCYAPKKKHQSFDQCFHLKLLIENDIFLFRNSNKGGSFG